MSIENGTRVRVHYKGTLGDGTEFDNSYQRGEPIEFEMGSGSVIPGFEAAVREMSVGDTSTVTIPADEAYGPRYEEAVQQVPTSQLPEGAFVGAMLRGMTEDGRPVAGTIVELEGDNAKIDFNHPLAGEDLTFELELVEIVED
ncbi:MAG: peptidylprolyl isomerase [Coriobacteriia bacterium]